jgi:hypothetical protein
MRHQWIVFSSAAGSVVSDVILDVVFDLPFREHPASTTVLNMTRPRVVSLFIRRKRISSKTYLI